MTLPLPTLSWQLQEGQWIKKMHIQPPSTHPPTHPPPCPRVNLPPIQHSMGKGLTQKRQKKTPLIKKWSDGLRFNCKLKEQIAPSHPHNIISEYKWSGCCSQFSPKHKCVSNAIMNPITSLPSTQLTRLLFVSPSCYPPFFSFPGVQCYGQAIH